MRRLCKKFDPEVVESLPEPSSWPQAECAGVLRQKNAAYPTPRLRFTGECVKYFERALSLWVGREFAFELLLPLVDLPGAACTARRMHGIDRGQKVATRDLYRKLDLRGTCIQSRLYCRQSGLGSLVYSCCRSKLCGRAGIRQSAFHWLDLPVFPLD